MEEQNTAIELLQMNGEVRVDSRILAKGIDVEHETLLKTVYTYESELEEFGVIRFEIGKPPKGSQGGRPEKYTLLNRNQAGIVISLSRNTTQVVRFKVDLFKAIDKLEKQLTQPAPSDMLTQFELDVQQYPERLKEAMQLTRARMRYLKLLQKAEGLIPSIEQAKQLSKPTPVLSPIDQQMLAFLEKSPLTYSEWYQAFAQTIHKSVATFDRHRKKLMQLQYVERVMEDYTNCYRKI